MRSENSQNVIQVMKAGPTTDADADVSVGTLLTTIVMILSCPGHNGKTCFSQLSIMLFLLFDGISERQSIGSQSLPSN